MFESTNPQNISVFFNCIFNVFEKKLIMLYFENLGTTYNPSIFKWLARGLGPPSAGHNSRQCYGNIAGAL